ncbi:MAG: hypothetical protein AAAFM81_14585 [Pseudomonadota bacterium]
MMTSTKNWLTLAMRAFVVLASLHAPLHAEEPANKAELVRLDSASTMVTLDQREILKTTAAKALADAKAAMKADIAVDLAATIGAPRAPVVADNPDN